MSDLNMLLYTDIWIGHAFPVVDNVVSATCFELWILYALAGMTAVENILNYPKRYSCFNH